ncbi:PREDICTED: uncharacterized protein LOC107340052 [Acropora digitifera]|uniref:uncharacterized protein LOC107340052 n=1 Tax=Acropora digitifera TaxID=70779 RepID=UPI00077A7470|nr:PREDICTED: uncharacterized protein LOC107340052 [Acropora digitifera]
MVKRVDGSNPMRTSPERKEKLISFNNSGDTIILILEGTSIVEDPSWNYRDSDTYQWNQMVTEQGAYASKPLGSLVNDLSDFVEKIFQRLDIRIKGAGHYEVIANHFGFDIFEIRSGFEKSVGGPSRAMIEAIVARHPELTIEKFARVVEEIARRKDETKLDVSNNNSDFYICGYELIQRNRLSDAGGVLFGVTVSKHYLTNYRDFKIELSELPVRPEPLIFLYAINVKV